MPQLTDTVGGRLFQNQLHAPSGKRYVPETRANGFHCLSFSFFLSSETRLFRGLRRLRGRKFFCFPWGADMPEDGARLKPAHLMLGHASCSLPPLRCILRELCEIPQGLFHAISRLPCGEAREVFAIAASFDAAPDQCVRFPPFVRSRVCHGCRLREERSEVTIQGAGRQGVCPSFEPRSKRRSSWFPASSST